MSASPSVHAYNATRLEYALDVSFERFTRRFESLIGKMDLVALRDIAGRPAEEVRQKLAAFVGPSDFTLFQKLDHGALLQVFANRPARATTYVFGNALIAIEMTKHVSSVGLYVPLRLFVEETAPEHVRVTYDFPSATLGQFGSTEVAAVARSLDAKVERLVVDSAQGPEH